jgi:hypothetical protein
MPKKHDVDFHDDPDLDSQGEDREEVERERENLAKFVKSLSPDDLRTGNWFEKLLAHALRAYTNKVDAKYFLEKYEGVPADAIVDQRIKMAARYAAIEGGLSAGAYTAAIVATLGTLGGAAAGTIPAAIATVAVDVAFVTQLQIRLAYDIAVLYRIPLDVSDPEDLWKLIRVAFTIKSGEAVREGLTKVVPLAVRPAIKMFYKGPVLAAARGLPFVGKFLLQRNVIKIGIPLIGVPLAVVLNRYSTIIAGRHARIVFRNEARVLEVAKRMSNESKHPQTMLWVAWLLIASDSMISDDEALLMRHLVRAVRERHEVVDEELANLVNVETADVWRRLDSEPGELSDVLAAAQIVAAIDGEVSVIEAAVIAELESRYSRR